MGQLPLCPKSRSSYYGLRLVFHKLSIILRTLSIASNKHWNTKSKLAVSAIVIFLYDCKNTLFGCGLRLLHDLLQPYRNDVCDNKVLGCNGDNLLTYFFSIDFASNLEFQNHAHNIRRSTDKLKLWLLTVQTAYNLRHFLLFV